MHDFLAVLSCLFYKVNPRVILFGSTLSSCRGLDWNCLRSVISLGTTGGRVVTKLCPTLATPWTVARQAPLSRGFSRQECWSGLPFPSPGDLPNPGTEPRSPTLQADSLPTELQGKHKGTPGALISVLPTQVRGLSLP